MFYKKKYRIDSQPMSGQSLLEVVVAVGLVTLVLSALISALTFSLANAQFARNKTQASKFAQQAVEWVRTQRDQLGWTIFYSRSTTTPGTTYCLNSLPADFATYVAGACTTGALITGTIFTRNVTLTGNGTLPPNSSDKVKVTVTVTWISENRTNTVTTDTILAKWL